MGQVIVLKHVRLTKAFQAVEHAILSLDTELGDLRALSDLGLPDFPEETAMLRAYVRTLSVLLQAMTPDAIDEAGLSDRHASAEAMVSHCAETLKSFMIANHPVAISGTA